MSHNDVFGSFGEALSMRKRIELKVVDRATSLFPKEIEELKKFFDTSEEQINSVIVGAIDFVGQRDKKKAKSEFFGGLMRSLGSILKSAPKEHYKFKAEILAELDRWVPLYKVVVAARARELQSAKVLYRRKKYDLSEIKQTFYGSMVLEALGFGNRSVLNKSEYEIFSSKVNEMGFDLPEEVSPTIAELYFESSSGDEASE
ncbi:MAG: hypothetical protein ACFFEU_03655 [Candidatus Thorarchaeota archaeon]